MTDEILYLFPELARGNYTYPTVGILTSRQIRDLIESGHISSETPITEEQIQPASIDLRLGSTAYRIQASFLPGPSSTVEKKLHDVLMAELDLTKPTVFEKGCVYLIPLMEELNLPSGISAKANPRSTTGRLDIFTRLVTDYGTEFERVVEGYKGKLYAEVVPRTYTILVGQGAKLNQIRFMRGDSIHSDTNSAEATLRPQVDRISMNLQANSPSDVIGYKAKRDAPIINLQWINFYRIEEFWDRVSMPKAKSLILNPGDFYILGSKEKIQIPVECAAEMIPFDPSLGEFRIHYAGFFDPGFGYGRNDTSGTPAVLEVRAHEVPFLIEDGQTIGRLIFLPLLEPADKVYGTEIGSSYQHQLVSLSKHFKRD